jgi:hypothetical protein
MQVTSSGRALEAVGNAGDIQWTCDRGCDSCEQCAHERNSSLLAPIQLAIGMVVPLVSASNISTLPT